MYPKLPVLMGLMGTLLLGQSNSAPWEMKRNKTTSAATTEKRRV
jgi:hypothetical protein